MTARFNLIWKLQRAVIFDNFCHPCGGPPNLRIQRHWRSSMTCKTSSSSTSAHSGTAKKELTHCGAQISETLSGHWKIVQGNYFKWQKPITIPRTAETRSLSRKMSARRCLVFWEH
jgi:hypothetical protein